MKRILPFFFSLALGILLAISSKAQSILGNKTYRVTAFKNGNHAVVSTSNYQEIVPPLSIFIPDAFTPNGDGINDSFGIKGEGIQNMTLRIFNRWGEEVFETSNPKQQWDGNYKDKPAESGVYVYQLVSSGKSSETKTGSVTLIR